MSKRGRIILFVVAIIMMSYIIFAAALYRPLSDNVVSDCAEVMVKDSLAHHFVKSSEIRSLIRSHGISMEKMPVDSVLLDSIENVVETHPMVRKAECFTLPSGVVKVVVWQRIPVARLHGDAVGWFYLDEDCKPMKIDVSRTDIHVMDLPVFTGKVSMTDTMMFASVYYMARQLSESEYWGHLIQEVEVDSKGQWIFHPAEGDFDIRFGYPENYSFKLGAIRSFYENVLPRVGDKYYSHLSLEYEGQLICTKRKH